VIELHGGRFEVHGDGPDTGKEFWEHLVSSAIPGATPPVGVHVFTPRRGHAHHGIHVGRGKVVQYRGLGGRSTCSAGVVSSCFVCISTSERGNLPQRKRESADQLPTGTTRITECLSDMVRCRRYAVGISDIGIRWAWRTWDPVYRREQATKRMSYELARLSARPCGPSGCASSTNR
jgi:hypothetical protein